MSNLPEEFRLIRLRLAREPGHPQGDDRHGYDIVAPLDNDGRILPDSWKKHREVCHVRRIRPNEAAESGLLARHPGGAWYIDYDADDDSDNEAGFRFNEEQFVSGEYVSIREDDGELHTFQVTFVGPV